MFGIGAVACLATGKLEEDPERASSHSRNVRSRWSIVAMSCVSSTAPSSVERRRVVSELRAGRDDTIPRRPEIVCCRGTVLDRRTLRVLVSMIAC